MKRLLIGIIVLSPSLLTTLVTGQVEGSATRTSAPAPAAQSRNPQQIAQLKWYGANTTTNFAVGTQPRGVCFDGANVWVANYGSNTVTKLRANDGSVLGTYNVGTQPANVAFDGANIWVSNFGSGTVTKLRAGDGKLLATFTVGGQPSGLPFDATNPWGGNAVRNPLVPRLVGSD